MNSCPLSRIPKRGHVPSFCSSRTKLSAVRFCASELRAARFSSTSLRIADVSLSGSSRYILHLTPASSACATHRHSSSLALAASRQPLFCHIGAAMAQRRTQSTQAGERRLNGNGVAQNHDHDHHAHSHSHSHSHSIFGHSHSHNGEDGHAHSHDAEQIVAALRGDKRESPTRLFNSSVSQFLHI